MMLAPAFHKTDGIILINVRPETVKRDAEIAKKAQSTQSSHIEKQEKSLRTLRPFFKGFWTDTSYLIWCSIGANSWQNTNAPGRRGIDFLVKYEF